MEFLTNPNVLLFICFACTLYCAVQYLKLSKKYKELLKRNAEMEFTLMLNKNVIDKNTDDIIDEFDRINNILKETTFFKNLMPEDKEDKEE